MIDCFELHGELEPWQQIRWDVLSIFDSIEINLQYWRSQLVWVGLLDDMQSVRGMWTDCTLADLMTMVGVLEQTKIFLEALVVMTEVYSEYFGVDHEMLDLSCLVNRALSRVLVLVYNIIE